jgi:hypothetical protein
MALNNLAYDRSVPKFRESVIKERPENSVRKQSATAYEEKVPRQTLH